MSIIKFHVLHLFFISIYSVITVGADLMRCYCNLPECMDNAANSNYYYYCKSRAGCFQELPHYNSPHAISGKGYSTTGTPNSHVELRYGCLELWPSDSAPFQCTEPGIRKSPLVNGNGARRHISDNSDEYDEVDNIEHTVRNGRMKNSDRRRRPITNRYRNQQPKIVESRPWISYDVPLRCCTGDMCNRRNGISASKLLNKIAPVSFTMVTGSNRWQSSTPSHAPIYHPVPTTVTAIATSQNWWLVSTMIFVPVIGGMAFFLLVIVGCWILHCGGENPCKNGDDGKDKVITRLPACYVYDDDGTTNVDTKLVSNHLGQENMTKSSGKWVVLHFPILLAKSNGSCVVDVKTASSLR